MKIPIHPCVWFYKVQKTSPQKCGLLGHTQCDQIIFPTVLCKEDFFCAVLVLLNIFASFYPLLTLIPYFCREFNLLFIQNKSLGFFGLNKPKTRFFCSQRMQKSPKSSFAILGGKQTSFSNFSPKFKKLNKYLKFWGYKRPKTAKNSHRKRNWIWVP